MNKDPLLRWRKRNTYYYSWLDKIYKYSIRPHSRVLHVGCQCGDLLTAVKPAYGVGIDPDTEKIALAKKRFPDLVFLVGDPHELDMQEKFDYIIISNSLGQWKDIQCVMEKIKPLTTEKTRLIISYYNYMWEWILHLGSLLKLRSPEPYQNWLPTEDIANLLDLAGYDVIRKDSYVILPKRIPLLTPFCNYVLSILPGFRIFNLINVVVARPLPEVRNPGEITVSVIIPCRNERGNIEDAVRKIPNMGKATEIIFIDGNSTDNTPQEIERVIGKYPQKNIHLIHQGDGVGKGDAVRKGFEKATGDLLVIQDADLTAPPEDLPKFFHAYLQGKGEFINGSRLVYPMKKQAMRFLNLLGNKFFSLLFSWLLGQRFRDTLCGTKMISKVDYSVLAANRSYFGNFDPFGDFDLIFGSIKQNLKVKEVPVTYHARTYGDTNISRFRHGLLLLKMSWIAFKKIKWLVNIH